MREIHRSLVKSSHSGPLSGNALRCRDVKIALAISCFPGVLSNTPQSLTQIGKSRSVVIAVLRWSIYEFDLVLSQAIYHESIKKPFGKWMPLKQKLSRHQKHILCPQQMLGIYKTIKGYFAVLITHATIKLSCVGFIWGKRHISSIIYEE